MADDPKTPADRLIEQFGVDRLATWTKRHRSRVHAWTWSTVKGGTGGVVPPRVRALIIEGAHRDLGAELAYADFEPKDGEVYLLGEAA